MFAWRWCGSGIVVGGLIHVFCVRKTNIDWEHCGCPLFSSLTTRRWTFSGAFSKNPRSARRRFSRAVFTVRGLGEECEGFCPCLKGKWGPSLLGRNADGSISGPCQGWQGTYKLCT